MDLFQDRDKTHKCDRNQEPLIFMDGIILSRKAQKKPQEKDEHFTGVFKNGGIFWVKIGKSRGQGRVQ